MARGRTLIGGLASAAALVAASVAGCSGITGGRSPGSAASRSPASGASRRASPSGPATFPGPDGTEARWVIDENSKPGTTAWQIHGAHSGIAGFASRVYARQGQKVTLYVDTTGPWFRAEAFRMGYYQGKGARLVWESGKAAGRRQPACPVTPGINMVSCDNWSPSLTFTVTRAFIQGDYLIKLAGPGNRQSYVPLTVWDPASTAAYVIKNDVFTWQAWNPYGGYDFYRGLGSCPAGHYPLCSRSRVVSFDRPYGAEDGSGNFLSLEYPLVRWAEQHGLDVTYATDLTVEQHPGYLLRHKVLLSLGHDECWALAERKAAVTAHEHGVNIVFFAASPMLRHVRMQASPLGPGREEVDYRDSAKDPLNGKGSPLEVTGNEWASPPANWPEYSFVGDTYEGFLEPGLSTGLRVADASSWVFAGTGLRGGSVVPGVVASDVDKFDKAMGQPANDQ
ncbi:MAG TPA: N,N-dimethylformamidase beta subunit family domain-containing protein, partial [Streptosporangiaceae bacterium]|nr:N,N-dimethylformamidase beta subunit family domain-containing protein [Streptosporangiaceae bacterium]